MQMILFTICEVTIEARRSILFSHFYRIYYILNIKIKKRKTSSIIKEICGIKQQYYFTNNDSYSYSSQCSCVTEQVVSLWESVQDIRPIDNINMIT